MVRKSLAVAALLVSAQVASAQSYGMGTTDSVVTVETKDTDKFRVETNRFGSNWFIGAGVGGQVYFGDHDKQMKFGDRITPNFELYFGKWFTPGLGVRIGANGYKIKGVSGWTQHGQTPGNPGLNAYNYQGFIKLPQEIDEYATKKVGYPMYKTETKYFHIHGDVMFNLSQMILGYKPNRFYNLIPYASLGWIQSTNRATSGEKSHEVTGGVGILNTFRLGSAWSINLDVRASYTGDHFDQESVAVNPNGKYTTTAGAIGEGLLTASIGLQYNFTKRGWDRSQITTIRVNENVLADLRNRLGDLESANADLRAQLENALNRKVTAENVAAQPLLVTFPIDRWVLSKKDRVNLGFLAETLKANPNMTYTIVGYADQGTGSSKRNVFLSRKRSEVVYDCLVKEFGVSESQLKRDFKGGVGNMYYNDPRLSRAVLTKIAE